MTIATATPAEVRTLYNKCIETQKVLQQYVQGSANGAKGNLSYLTVAQVTTLVTALEAAAAAVK